MLYLISYIKPTREVMRLYRYRLCGIMWIWNMLYFYWALRDATFDPHSTQRLEMRLAEFFCKTAISSITAVSDLRTTRDFSQLPTIMLWLRSFVYCKLTNTIN